MCKKEGDSSFLPYSSQLALRHPIQYFSWRSLLHHNSSTLISYKLASAFKQMSKRQDVRYMDGFTELPRR